jgi:hypothetical protein
VGKRATTGEMFDIEVSNIELNKFTAAGGKKL